MNRRVEKLVFFGYNEMIAQATARAHAAAIDLDIVIVADQTQAGRELSPGSHFGEVTSLGRVTGIVEDDLTGSALDAALSDMDTTLAISVGAPWFFDKDFISDRLQNRILNLHGTRLPTDRGGAIFSWAILRGQRTGLCLLHRLNERIDAGEVIRFEEFIYPPGARTPGELMADYELRNIEFLHRFMADIATNSLELANNPVLPDYLSSYWPRLDARLNGWLDWGLDLYALERFICAFDEPYAGARTMFGDTEVVLRDVYAQSVDGSTHPYQWGIVFRKSPGWITIAVNGGELLAKSVTDTDGNDMAASLNVGDRFATSMAQLEKALQRPTRAGQLARSDTE